MIMTFAIWRAEQDVRLGEATNSDADRPAIAYLPNGGYVVGWRCAPKARITSGGRFHPESCRLIW
jgi:hypothetical protein